MASLREVVDRNAFWRAAFIYQIIDGEIFQTSGADAGLTTERYGPLRGKMSLLRFQDDTLPDDEPIPEEEYKPDPTLPIKTDFLKMEQPQGAAWGLNPPGYTITNVYPSLPEDERPMLIAALKDRGYTHIVLTARTAGDLGYSKDWYKHPEKLVPYLKELLAAEIQPILFLSVDDDPWMAGLGTQERISLFLSGLKHWEPYVASVCTSIEWDEWGTRDALVETVKAVKDKYPDLFVWVHFLGDWTERLNSSKGFRGYERFPGADGLFYQQPPTKKENGVVVDRKPFPHIYTHTRELASRCKRDGWAFCHAEYRQLKRYTEEDALDAGDAGVQALLELGMPLSYANGAREEV
jgi:hypothetical protein